MPLAYMQRAFLLSSVLDDSKSDLVFKQPRWCSKYTVCPKKGTAFDQQ